MSRVAELVEMGLEVNADENDHAADVLALVNKIGLRALLTTIEDAADGAADVHKGEDRDELAEFSLAISNAKKCLLRSAVNARDRLFAIDLTQKGVTEVNMLGRYSALECARLDPRAERRMA